MNHIEVQWISQKSVTVSPSWRKPRLARDDIRH
jgi:hypothetical protein